jgi:hypothetical protein
MPTQLLLVSFPRLHPAGQASPRDDMLKTWLAPSLHLTMRRFQRRARGGTASSANLAVTEALPLADELAPGNATEKRVG